MTDQTAAARPVPTFADRTATLEELRAERVKTGRLEGDLRSLAQAVREALAERDRARATARTGYVELGQARQTAAFRQGVIDRHRQELGAAGDVLAVVRDAVERIDRALATYDTTPGEEAEREDGRPELVAEDIAVAIETHFLPDNLTAVQAARIARHHATQYGPAASSVPSRRAQEEPASEEIRWAYRWLDTDGNVLDEMDTRDNVRETAEERARRLAANRPPSIPRGDVVRYRVVTTAEVVATYPTEARP